MAERAAPTETIGNHCSLISSATAEELTVSRILLELRILMDLVEGVPGPKWGRKRRRSCLFEDPPSLLLKRMNVEMKAQVKAVEEQAGVSTSMAAAAAATASPVTPLAFPPSEPDEKPRRALKRSYRKRSKQEYLGMIEELTQRRDLLQKEIEKVTKHYSQLRAYNSQLKAAKEQVLNSCPMKEEPQKERIVGMNLGAELISQDHGMGVAPHLKPLVADHRTAENNRASVGPIGSGNGLMTVDPMDSNGIPDLNVNVDVVFGDGSQPLDLADIGARSTEARMRRKGIIKAKARRLKPACGGSSNLVRTR